jgi:Zn-dependent protease with chaperone function
MQMWERIWQSIRLLKPNPADILPLGYLLNFSIVLEAVPLLAVFVGVLTIFVPKIRTARLERQFRLSAPPQKIAVMQEICDFIYQNAPRIVVRANLQRFDQLAFAYPVGYQKAAIALFGGFIKLWRMDQKAAQAVLLHEIAHYRQGDVMIVGAGSFFKTLFERWLALYLGLVLLPLVLVWGYETFIGLRKLYVLQELGVPLSDAEILLHKISLFFSIFLPGVLLISFGLLFWTASIIILPLIGIWCAELNADRFAIETTRSPGNLIRALQNLPAVSSRWRWLIFRMTHPPNRLRCWTASHSDTQMGLAVLLLLFPLTYILKLILLVAWAITGYLMTTPGTDIAPALWINTKVYLEMIAPVWLAMAMFIFLWPKVAGHWEWIFSRHRGIFSWVGYRGYFVNALLISILAVTGYIADRTISGGLPNEKPPSTVEIQWRMGQHVEVEWQGKWWPAEILNIEGNSFSIHYENFDSSWDEWVEVSRIRQRSK